MQSRNPALSRNFGEYAVSERTGDVMTMNGAVFKTAILLGLAVCTAAVSWGMVFSGNTGMVPLFVFGGAIGGLIFALITIFVPKASPFTAPIYALCEGLFLGAISAMFEAQFQYIAAQAAGLTFGTLFVMLAAYSTGLIKPTQKFKAIVLAAGGAICLVYLVSFILRMFNFGDVFYLHDTGPIGIGISVVVVIVAALFLILDFDLIESNANAGAPKYMEWYCAFSLMLTIVWLYLEFLRLLSKLRR